MFFWNIDACARQLNSDSMSQQEKSRYYVAAICGVYSMYMLVAWSLSAVTITLFSCFGIVIGCIAVPRCLKVNQRNDNKHFIERMVCLGFVATLRILVCSVAVIVIGTLLEQLFMYQVPVMALFVVQGILICCIHSCFYIMVARGMRVKK